MKYDINGLDRAEVLSVLFNQSVSRGRSLDYKEEDLTIGEAGKLLAGKSSFSLAVVKNRLVYFELSSDGLLDTQLYDRVHGVRAAEKLLDELRRRTAVAEGVPL